MLASRTLFDSPIVTVTEVACNAPRGGDQGDEIQQSACIAFPLRGCFAVERQAHTAVADTNTSMFFDTATVHRVSHPANDGDVSLVLAFDDATTADAFGGSLPAAYAPVAPWLRLRLQLIRNDIASAPDPQKIEEAALDILAAIAGSNHPLLSHTRLAVIERAKAFMAENFCDRLLLHDIAVATSASAFGLARAFRAATGMTLHRYLVALRHNAALDAITAGKTDLSRLAAELGFAHHSHLTKTFARAFSSTPSALRARLTANTPPASKDQRP